MFDRNLIMSKKTHKSMTPKAAARITSDTAKKAGGIVEKRTFAARAKRAADKNNNKPS